MPDLSLMEAAPAEGVTDAFNRDAVERLAAGEPDWLRARRLHAWDVYERTPLPTTRHEQWRYTDLKQRLQLEALRVPTAGTRARVDKADWPARLREALSEDQNASGHLVILDGAVVRVDVRPDLAAKGVVLTSLRDAVRAQAKLLREHLATEAVPPEEGKFPALNGALWGDGVFLHVPKDVQLDQPVRVAHWVSAEGVALFTRTLIVADRFSRVSFVDEVLSDDLPRQTLVSNAVEVIARDSAQVQYVSLQRLGKGAFYQSQQRTLAGRDSTRPQHQPGPRGSQRQQRPALQGRAGRPLTRGLPRDHPRAPRRAAHRCLPDQPQPAALQGGAR
jgi:Fe-S cluster assembly protein SufD